MTVVRFPAYRRHELARVEANDAMLTLLISSRLASHVLDLMQGSTVFLPDVFPAVPEIRRLNRSVADTQLLMARSEWHLAMMAIPFALSVHHAYARDCTRLLLDDGQLDPAKTTLERVHDYLMELTGVQLDKEDLALFQLARRIRNRILHASGIAGSDERAEYSQKLSLTARTRWERRAKRPLDAEPGRRIRLGAGELYAVLGTSKNLADELNSAVVQAVSRDRWALIAANDYLQSAKTARDRDRHLRSLRGFCDRQFYKALAFTDQELEEGWDRALEIQKEGSTD